MKKTKIVLVIRPGRCEVLCTVCHVAVIAFSFCVDPARYGYPGGQKGCVCVLRPVFLVGLLFLVVGFDKKLFTNKPKLLNLFCCDEKIVPKIFGDHE